MSRERDAKRAHQSTIPAHLTYPRQPAPSTRFPPNSKRDLDTTASDTPVNKHGAKQRTAIEEKKRKKEMTTIARSGSATEHTKRRRWGPRRGAKALAKSVLSRTETAAQQHKKEHEVDALLVRCDGTATTVTVDRRTGRGMAKALGCVGICRWPYAYTLDTVVARDGRTYRYDVWIDAEASPIVELGVIRRPRTSPDNLYASLAAHPLNEATDHVIGGSALLVSVVEEGSGRHLRKADWEHIWAAVSGVTDPCDGDVDEVVVANCHGATALCRRAGRERFS